MKIESGYTTDLSLYGSNGCYFDFDWDLYLEF